MEKGTIKVFFTEKERRYGFVLTESGEQLFFHFGDGEFIVAGKTAPEFSGKAKMVIGGQLRGMRDPQRDDIIMFDRKLGGKGQLASPWGYKTHHDRALEVIARRPKPLLYRVVTTFDSPPGTSGEPHIEWGGEQGRTLEELCARYPRDRWDDLKPFSDTDNIFDKRSEIQVNDGSGWKAVKEDPRPVINASRPVRRSL